MSTIGIDQHGAVYRIGNNPPRKYLMDYLGCTHVEQMWIDRKGKPVHIGYIIQGRWIKIYNVTDWKE